MSIHNHPVRSNSSPMRPQLTVILEHEEMPPSSGGTRHVSRINRQIFLKKVRSDIVHERKAGRSTTAHEFSDSDVVSSHYADTEPQPINVDHQEDDTAKSTRSSSPFNINPFIPHGKTMEIPPPRDAVRSGLGKLNTGHDGRRSGLRFSSEPPRKLPEDLTFPAPSTIVKDPALQPLRRPFKDKDSEGCTTWYTGSSNSPIARPPSTFGVYGDLYLHSIRGTNRPPLIWLMDDHSTWQRIEEGCTHPYITDRCLRIRGSGEPSWVLKASLATMRHRKEKVTRS
ncbi:hypothetical protein PLEOSDRAFT_156303 [Pleurotus ostreatus PC15]|uniref:Uncharacterized protein n=1 Tax=Pleurotus ostreatus (strain PC15) TaxID=1137138 RepID=A0A067NY56_PLEO1|nr:hypothetical protein PLEOSDRAFT_156303 [Pleurotus ostreatus PC15]